MMDFISNFVDDHPCISSIIGAIIIELCFIAVIGFMLTISS